MAPSIFFWEREDILCIIPFEIPDMCSIKFKANSPFSLIKVFIRSIGIKLTFDFVKAVAVKSNFSKAKQQTIPIKECGCVIPIVNGFESLMNSIFAKPSVI